MKISSVSSSSYTKAINVIYIKSVFFKFVTKNAESDNFEELYLNLEETKIRQNFLPSSERTESYVMRGV